MLRIILTLLLVVSVTVHPFVSDVAFRGFFAALLGSKSCSGHISSFNGPLWDLCLGKFGTYCIFGLIVWIILYRFMTCNPTYCSFLLVTLRNEHWTCTAHCAKVRNNIFAESVIILITCVAFQGPNASCATPDNLAGQSILDVLKTSTAKPPPETSSTGTTTKPASAFTTVTASTKTFITIQSSSHRELTTVSRRNISSKGDYGCFFFVFLPHTDHTDTSKIMFA